jgi:hypothetical protein
MCARGVTTLIVNWNSWIDIVEYLLEGGIRRYMLSYRYLARLVFRCGIARSNHGSIYGKGSKA